MTGLLVVRCCFSGSFKKHQDGSMGSTAGGKVFVWGCNSDGRLGLGHDRTEPLPVIVPWHRW